MLRHSAALLTCFALQATSTRAVEEGSLLQVKPHLTATPSSATGPVQATWGSLSGAFTEGDEPDLPVMLDAYDDDAVVTFYNQNQNQIYRYEGKASIERFFGWFLPRGTSCTFDTDVTEAENEGEGGGSVLLTWFCGIGYTEGTDTFIFNGDSKVLFQNVVVNYTAADPPSGDAQVPPTSGPVTNWWSNHGVGFGASTVPAHREFGIGKMLEGYTDNAAIVLYNHFDDSKTVYDTDASRRTFFENLFESFYDLSDFGFQFFIEENEPEETEPGQLLLTWSGAACGYKRGTDTFILNADGRVTHQNVVVNYEGAPCRSLQHENMCENGKKKNKEKFRCPCTAPVCGKGQRKKCADGPNTDDLTSDAYDPLCAFCKPGADRK